MKLTADRTRLLAAISAVLHFADDGRGLLEAEGDSCTVSGAAVVKGMGARHAVESAEADRPTRLTVPLALLQGWLSDSAAERVRLLVTERGAVVQGTEGERLSFGLSDALTVPVVTPPEDAVTVTADAGEFRRAVGRVAFAAMRPAREGKWATKAVRFDAGKRDGLTLSATDEVQLAVATVPPKEKVAGKIEHVLVPVQTVRQWAKVRPAEGSADATLRLWSGGVSYQVGPLEAWTTVVTGKFPTPQAVTRPYRVALPAGELTRALRMALAGADPDPDDEVDPLIRYVVLRFDSGSVTVKGEASEEGLSSAVEVPLPAGAKVPDLAATIDGFRLLQYLKAVAGEPEVTVCWEGARRPIEVRAGERSWYLTSPRLSREAEAA